jgi:rhamnosyl/mannosyltransferase
MDKVRVIPYGVDTARFDAGRVPPERRAEVRARFGTPLVVATGRLVYYKGLHHLIEAARRVDAAVAIVGTGPLEADLRRQASSLPRVTLTGAVPEEDLIATLASADCFVLPSISHAESFGIATLEAQAMGIPAVVTDVGTATVEAIEPGVTGLVVAPGDPMALAQAIESIVADAALRERMGNAARRRTLERFSIGRMAESFRALYHEVSEAPPQRRRR